MKKKIIKLITYNISRIDEKEMKNRYKNKLNKLDYLN